MLYALADSSDDTGQRRLLAQAKNNLNRTDLPVLGFTIESATVTQHSTTSSPVDRGTPLS